MKRIGTVIAKLLTRLDQQGLGPPLVRQSGDCLYHSDDLELRQEAGRYRVAELERGQMIELYCDTDDAAEACDTFARELARRSVFLAARSSQAAIDTLQRVIEQAGLRAYPNHVLSLPDVPATYRLFVPAMEWRQANAIITSMDSEG